MYWFPCSKREHVVKKEISVERSCPHLEPPSDPRNVLITVRSQLQHGRRRNGETGRVSREVTHQISLPLLTGKCPRARISANEMVGDIDNFLSFQKRSFLICMPMLSRASNSAVLTVILPFRLPSFTQPAEQGEHPDFCYKKSEGSRSVFYAL